MIGIPDEMLNKALDNMGTTIDEYIKYVTYAKQFTDKVIKGDIDPSTLYNDNLSVSQNATNEAMKKYLEGEKAPYEDDMSIIASQIPFNLPSEPDLPTTDFSSSVMSPLGFTDFDSIDFSPYQFNYNPGESFAVQGFFEDIFNSEIGKNIRKFLEVVLVVQILT